MSSTADLVLDAWRSRVAHPPKHESRFGNVWRGISPRRTSADNRSGFVLKITGPEHGTWKDFPANEGGSLYQLARELGVPLPQTGAAPSTKRLYADLSEYASAHGVTASVFAAAGWQDTTYQKRPALLIPTATGPRWRFVDGNEPPYKHETGYKRCWYGLDRAITVATRNNLPIVICNGEASTVVAQHFGVPACAITSGENRLPDDLLAQLNEAWQGDILLTYDCDDKGRLVAADVQSQLERSKVIDLELDNHGDLADFCRLWQQDTMKELMRRSRKVRTASVVLEDLFDDYISMLDGAEQDGKPLQIPFASWRRFEGFADVMSPGKLMAIMGASGQGKTSLESTLADLWAMDGEGGLWFGPEYDEHEMVMRRVQRYGGASSTQVRRHKLFMYDIMRNVPEDQVRGECMPADLMRKSKQIAQQLKEWPGRTEYFHSTLHLEDMLERMGRSIDNRREAGELVTYAVFDYAQILRSRDVNGADNAYEYCVGLIKKFVMDYRIVGVVGSQVTKQATGESRAGNVISSHQANWIRDDKFNLIATINLQYEQDARGNEVKTNRGIINIAKNNDGMTGTVKMIANFKQLIWLDKSW